MKIYLQAILFTIVSLFSGCSLDLGEDDGSVTPASEGCSSDTLGEYGTCVHFGNHFLVGGVWTVYDGNSSLESIDIQQLIFDANGEARYCLQGDCTHSDNFSSLPWNWRVVDTNLTLYDSTIADSVIREYQYYTQDGNDNLVFIVDGNTTKTFSNF